MNALIVFDSCVFTAAALVSCTTMMGWYLSNAVTYVPAISAFLVCPHIRMLSDCRTVVGYAYPAYCSFKALRTIDEHDDHQWLMYWIVFGLFNVFEFFADILISW